MGGTTFRRRNGLTPTRQRRGERTSPQGWDGEANGEAFSLPRGRRSRTGLGDWSHRRAGMAGRGGESPACARMNLTVRNGRTVPVGQAFSSPEGHEARAQTTLRQGTAPGRRLRAWSGDPLGTIPRRDREGASPPERAVVRWRDSCSRWAAWAGARGPAPPPAAANNQAATGRTA